MGPPPRDTLSALTRQRIFPDCEPTNWPASVAARGADGSAIKTINAAATAVPCRTMSVPTQPIRLERGCFHVGDVKLFNAQQLRNADEAAPRKHWYRGVGSFRRRTRRATVRAATAI